MKSKLKTDALDLTSLCNGLVFFAPVSLLVRTTAGVSLSQFFLLQAIASTVVLIAEVPMGKLTDRIGYQPTLVLYQVFLLLARVCLLAAYLRCSFGLFVLQAVVEGTAAALASGTQSAYVYSVFPPERYAEKSAHIANFGTLGFFVSTLAYAVVYAAVGIQGLLLGTIAANGAAVLLALRIPRETKEPVRQTPEKRRSGGLTELFRHRKIWALLLVLAALNLGRILINFFYAEKLLQCGIHESWLTGIILGYSALEMLSERILARSRREKYGQLLVLFFLLSGAALGILGLSGAPVWVILFMLVLPLLLDIPSYLLGEIQNKIVDAAGRADSRAELLSVFNMGVNVTEILYLFGSSLLVNAGSAVCFVSLGVLMALAGVGAALLDKKKALFAPAEQQI